MSESDTVTAPPAEHDSSPAQLLQQEPKKPPSSGITFSIWPPKERTRDAVITRLIETLSTSSVLSKRYGTVPEDEASTAARRIEEEAYAVANAAASSEEDGLEILQLYSKEISKRMLDTVKSRVGPGPAVENSASEMLEEESSSVVTES